MKRSEVIKFLANHIREYVDESYEECEEEAEYILSKLEKMGMVPPMLPIPEYAFQADHAWEPEELVKADFGVDAGKNAKKGLFGEEE